MLHSIDSCGRLVSVSNHWLETLGYDRTEVIGRKLTEFLSDASCRYAEDEVLPEFFKTGYCWDIPYQFIKKNGETVDVLLSAICERDKEGNVIRSLAVLVDITEHKRMEEELFRVQKLESVGILAGGIAHDFNNLLACIMGYVDLAKSYLTPGDKGYQTLERAERACHNASDLTKRLITFSKGGEPVRKASSLAELLQTSYDLALRDSNVRCSFSLPDDLWPVFIDEGQMKQVVYHLVMNAREAMPGGGVITISAKNRTVTERDGLSLRGECMCNGLLWITALVFPKRT